MVKHKQQATNNTPWSAEIMLWTNTQSCSCNVWLSFPVCFPIPDCWLDSPIFSTFKGQKPSLLGLSVKCSLHDRCWTNTMLNNSQMSSKPEKPSLFLATLSLKLPFAQAAKSSHPIFQAYQAQDFLWLVLPGIPIFSSLPIWRGEEAVLADTGGDQRAGGTCSGWASPPAPALARGTGHVPEDFLWLVLGKAHPPLRDTSCYWPKGIQFPWDSVKSVYS